MSEKHFIPSNTANSQKAAVTKVLSALTENEKNLNEEIDIEELTQRFQNKSKYDLNPDSLRTYISRFKIAFSNFLEWNKNPLGYKPKNKRGRPEYISPKIKKVKPTNSAKPLKTNTTPFNNLTESYNLNSMVKYPILTEDGRGSLEIPRILTAAEISRIIPVITAIIKSHCREITLDTHLANKEQA